MAYQKNFTDYGWFGASTLSLIQLVVMMTNVQSMQ
jgi:hypothetical protein